jgi:hypothetical protein
MLSHPQYGVSGLLLEAGSPPGTKSGAGSVSVPLALLRSSSRRSGSILIVFEVTTFGYRGGKICRERAISLMSRLTSTYTIYGLLSTTSGLGMRHTGPAGLLGSTEMRKSTLLQRPQSPTGSCGRVKDHTITRGRATRKYLGLEEAALGSWRSNV